MPLHRHPAPRRPGAAVLAALVLPACAAWLAAAPPAVAQDPIEAPRLRNEAEIDRQVAARHPPALRQAGIRGEVRLKFRVLEDGTLDSASISVDRATDPAFAEPAAAIAREMRFAPATAGGRPVPVWIRYPLYFEVQDPPAEDTYELAAVEQMPSLQNVGQVARQISMRYPVAMRDSGISGVAVLRARVLEDGSVDSASVAVWLVTHLAFERPALTVGPRLRFAPARLAGRPVKVWIELPIHFEVEAPEPPQPDSAARARTPSGDLEDAGAEGGPAPGPTPPAPSPTRSRRPAG